MALSGQALGRCSMTRVFSVTTRVSTAEARNQHRDLLRRLGAAGGALWIAEFRDSLFHKKGVIAAARDDNPTKASSACQFYLAQGKVFTDEQLDLLEQNRLKRKIPTWQREVYKTLGGIPHLDQNYTVFGEVVQGIEMIDTIAAVKTGAADRPVDDVRMTVTVLKKKEAKKLEKQLGLASKP
jgi:peptidyl-prolyl cis-trans isomerase B (cyclophilin B)